MAKKKSPSHKESERPKKMKRKEFDKELRKLQVEAGVERVMGFATPEEVEYFLRFVPLPEKTIIHSVSPFGLDR